MNNVTNQTRPSRREKLSPWLSDSTGAGESKTPRIAKSHDSDTMGGTVSPSSPRRRRGRNWLFEMVAHYGSTEHVGSARASQVVKSGLTNVAWMRPASAAIFVMVVLCLCTVQYRGTNVSSQIQIPFIQLGLALRVPSSNRVSNIFLLAVPPSVSRKGGRIWKRARSSCSTTTTCTDRDGPWC